jgi:hypothetical protein
MKFSKFEKISSLLEYHSPEEVDKQILESYGLDESDISDIESVNEGLFDKFKNMLSKALPGGAINKAEKILKDYENIKKDTLKKIGSLRTTAFKAKIKANANKDDKNLADLAAEADDRMKRASRIVQNAEDKQMQAIEDRLMTFVKDKPDRVKSYVQMRVAEIQQKMAELEMKDAQNYGSEEELKKLEDIVKKRGALKQKYATKLEKIAKGGKDAKNTGQLDKEIETAKKDLEKVEGGKKEGEQEQKKAA